MCIMEKITKKQYIEPALECYTMEIDQVLQRQSTDEQQAPQTFIFDEGTTEDNVDEN